MTALDVDLTLTIDCAADGCARPAVVAGVTICPGSHGPVTVCHLHHAVVLAEHLDAQVGDGAVVCDEHQFILPMPPVEWRHL
ncbi:hypothetical protein Xcel_0584 [Xylanimonas cellulosilytica DSM 15894]|uniref:Uncharacterized protein n=1 Tax=Xylanimonas cellulosilytica (strain DSM 15894 / JCM 12276 / CECT 5975 / KCTC 9989 / LMG 20990 / NBRC 107835 / XIL07) TaxID=446471 RepID=D1BWP1_XYLCX|nr:hypothetical protein [Xylanimonas cellulosilytica]ACZ29623.1 hypothetical protein Xcel_0584 [Xylanimonas cellulosilytica DSM 15894]